MYSNTFVTPEPVFADVKKSFGRRSGWGGVFIRTWFREWPCEFVRSRVGGVGGVDGSVGEARRRVKRLGVIVGADEEEDADAEVMRRECAIRMEPGDVIGPFSCMTELLLDCAGVGEDRADSYESKKDDEGVWYIEYPVRVVVIVPP
jgi:hypothetical protein